jgi:hypothetical protein
VRWYIDGVEMYRAPRIGFRPPDFRQSALIDRGGVDEPALPGAISVGFGTFTLLDGFDPLKPGAVFTPPLVKLSSVPGLYRNPYARDPLTGAPLPLADEQFVDPTDQPGSRIFALSPEGTPTTNSQGVVLIARDLVVSIRPIARGMVAA